MAANDEIQGSADGRSGSQALDELMSPYTAAEFLSRYWGREPLYVKREPSSRYYELFPWERLSEILEQNSMLPPRMVLTRKGQQVPFREYLEPADKPGYPPKVKPLALLKTLNTGTSLIINDADKLHPPLRHLLFKFELLFRMPVFANLYAAWGKDEGFQLHWDDQDTIIVQVMGRKRWTIYAPTVDAPVKAMKEDIPKPQGPPHFEGILNSGECMYVPRGWWHLVEPIGEPTLHLTVTFENPTGILLMRWLFNQLCENPVFRRDIPRDATQADFTSCCKTIATTLSAELARGDSLERFWRWSEARIQTPGFVKLPHETDRCSTGVAA